MPFPLHLQKITLQNHCVGLFVPDADAVKELYQKGENAFPFWSQLWPAALALSEFLVLHSHYIKNKNVLELGAGLGLPSIIAAPYAASVLCTDLIPEAVNIAKRSAGYNHLRNFKTAVISWQHLPVDLKADVLLLSDVNYEPSAFDALMEMLGKFLQKETTVILGTPQRLMAKGFIAHLLHHCIEQTEMAITYSGETVPISVFVLRSKQE